MGGTQAFDDPAYFQQPHVSQSAGETHSSLLTTTFAFNNFTVSVDMKTVAQLRQGSAPNPWETAWLFWDWNDNTHQYYCTLKTSGLEIGKVDGGAQVFVATPSTPTVKIGSYQNLSITQTNFNTSTPHIKCVVDGSTILDFDDTAVPNDVNLQHGGFIGLYNEDSRVQFRNVNISPI